ncbi:ankyrin repeat domain-containing protein [Candidatus Dependentiae bacterium]
MKRKNNDIMILLFALLLFSLGVGWIYSKSAPKPKKSPKPPQEITYKPKDIPKEEKAMPTNEILEYIKEWVPTKGISHIIEVLKEKSSKNTIVETLNKFLEQHENEFSRQEKLKIIISIGHHYKNNKKLQFQIFDIIAQNKNIEEGEVPLLFAAIKIGEKKAIADLVEWYKQSKRPKVRDLAKQTLEYAAKNDNADAIKKLHEAGAKIDKSYATELLWIVVKSNKGPKSIPFLKSLGADIDNYDPKTKYTVLIQAIKNKNLDTVKALVKAGVNIEKSSKDNSIGYPLQVARELDQVKIDLFLRSEGAED